MTNITKEAVEHTVKELREIADAQSSYAHDDWDDSDCLYKTLEQLTALSARVEELEAKCDALSEYSFEATKAIVGLTAGGSEFFAGKLPDGRYKADLTRCVKYVRDAKETLHDQVKRQYARGRLQGLDEALSVTIPSTSWGTEGLPQQYAEAIEALKGETTND